VAEESHGSPPRKTGYLPTRKRPGSPSSREVARVVRLNISELKEAQMRVALMARHLQDVEMALVLQHRMREYHKLRTLKLQPPF